jgi:hypothetical protein
MLAMDHQLFSAGSFVESSDPTLYIYAVMVLIHFLLLKYPLMSAHFFEDESPILPSHSFHFHDLSGCANA